MNILFAASECTPFAKTGGLADVIGSLPQALQKKGVNVRVVLPKYRDIPQKFKKKMEYKMHFNVPLSWRDQYCGIEVLEYQGIIYYFIDNEYYFGRSGSYGYYDDGERFAFFSKAVLEMLAYIDYQVDILHCHDWQTALISIYLEAHYNHYQDLKTIYTIHNLKYQGIYPGDIMDDLLGFDNRYFTDDGLEYYGNVNYMKGGLNFADIITTVSQTYAREIQTAYFGEGMDGILRKRSEDLYGIVNGIDYDEYNPEKDPHLFVNYKNSLDKKAENKIGLQKMLGLPVDREKPMFVLVSRLVEQKGIDLILHVIKKILAMDLQLVILGTGEYNYEQALRKAAAKYPEKFSANITFSEDLASKMYAAGDFFLMPSRFEPCGIGQLISLQYRTVPIVRETGGLSDTIKPYNEYSGEGNGFSFKNYNAHDMLYTIRRALDFYHNKKAWETIHANIEKANFSWNKSADEYCKIYEKLT
ncbi:MAG: glycogen synthase GlgA [Halothermotrichaceae bacterium]